MLRTAIADPAAVCRNLFARDAGQQMLPRSRYERSPTPTELEQFVGALGVGASREAAVDAWIELCDDATFRSEITAAFRSTDAGPEAFYHNWRDVLYVLIRLLEPECVVETGVRGGLSSAYILAAMAQNARGRLISVDVGDVSILPRDIPDRSVGWLVPERLRDRWDLRIGDSVTQLPAILEAEPVNVLFSDVPNRILEAELPLVRAGLPAGSVFMTCYPHGSAAESLWRGFAEASLGATASATRWESADGRSSLGAGIVLGPNAAAAD